MSFHRIFAIESKTFEVVLHGEGASFNGRLIERGRGYTRYVFVNEVVLDWLWRMVEGATASTFKDYQFRRLREKNHAFLLEFRKNDRGKYLALAEYSSRRRAGFIIIPEGKVQSGWKVASEALFSALRGWKELSGSNFLRNESGSSSFRLNKENFPPLYDTRSRMVFTTGMGRVAGGVGDGGWMVNGSRRGTRGRIAGFSNSHGDGRYKRMHERRRAAFSYVHGGRSAPASRTVTKERTELSAGGLWRWLPRDKEARRVTRLDGIGPSNSKEGLHFQDPSLLLGLTIAEVNGPYWVCYDSLGCKVKVKLHDEVLVQALEKESPILERSGTERESAEKKMSAQGILPCSSPIALTKLVSVEPSPSPCFTPAGLGEFNSTGAKSNYQREQGLSLSSDKGEDSSYLDEEESNDSLHSDDVDGEEAGCEVGNDVPNEKAVVVWVDNKADRRSFSKDAAAAPSYSLGQSDWILKKIEELSGTLGLSLCGVEKEAMRLFQAIEERRFRSLTDLPESSKKGKERFTESRRARELRKLECSVNYDIAAKKATKGKALVIK